MAIDEKQAAMSGGEKPTAAEAPGPSVPTASPPAPAERDPAQATERDPTQATEGAPAHTEGAPAQTEGAPTQTEGAATGTAAQPHRPRRRGFAAMDPERVRQIASKGGRAAHAAGTAHQFTSEEARAAGRKGGLAPHVRRGGVRRQPTPAARTGAQPPESARGQQGD